MTSDETLIRVGLEKLDAWFSLIITPKSQLMTEADGAFRLVVKTSKSSVVQIDSKPG